MTVDTKRERRHGRHTRWVRAATSAGVVALGVLLVPWGMDAGVSAVAASHDKSAAAAAKKRAAATASKKSATEKGTPAAIRNAGTKSITLNFRDADIQSVVGAFGLLLNRTFVIDQRVTGKINLETPKPVPAQQAYDMLLATLRLHGFTIVDTGNFSKVVPEADAKLQYGPVTVGEDAVSGGDRIVTQIFRINYESATNLVPVLRPLIGANNTITAYASNNSLIVTDYASNLQRIARIIATIDSPSTSEVEVVALKHSLATDVAVSVAKLLDESQRGTPGDAGQRVTVLADPRINSILIRSSSVAKVNLAKTLIARLDQTGDDGGKTHVVYLRNAEAIKLVETLRAVLGTEGRGASAAAAAPSASGLQASGNSAASSAGAASSNALQASASAPVIVSAGGAVIAADPTTNSLIITAPEPVYRNLRAVIEKLDSRRAQVFIESLIVEVSAEKAAEMGIQWQFLSAPEGTTRVIGGTNLPGRSAGGNILDATANLSAVGQGLNLGVVRGTTTLPGIGTVLNLGLLARALETQANANILATPTLLTLDNEEARIIIGQNVPFITGQFTATGTGGASVSPFQTIERRDVGTTLRVKPQISEGGAVKMAIFQEVSSVQDTSLAAGLITKRRAIESHVIVDDGQIVVLGGLIEEKIENGEQAVPGLGSIPGIGQLFRYDTRKLVKTNLLVFLRPVVIRDGNAAYGVTADRYDYIRQLRGDARTAPHWLLPDYTPGDMPNMPLPPEGAKPAAKQGSAPAPITRVLEGMAAGTAASASGVAPGVAPAPRQEPPSPIPGAAPRAVPMAQPRPAELYLN